MTGVLPPTTIYGEPLPYSTPIAGQTIGKGHLWALGTASFARALSPAGCLEVKSAWPRAK